MCIRDRKTAVSIMEQAKEKFLVAFKSINYKQGTATSILSVSYTHLDVYKRQECTQWDMKTDRTDTEVLQYGRNKNGE